MKLRIKHPTRKLIKKILHLTLISDKISRNLRGSYKNWCSQVGRTTVAGMSLVSERTGQTRIQLVFLENKLSWKS